VEVVSIEDDFEQTFLEYVRTDPLDYYFFIFDWKRRREQTRILLAIDGERIEGAALLYTDRVVQLRGNRKAVRLLLDFVDIEEVELQAPLDCEDLVLEKYKSGFRHELVLMRLQKGEENLQIKHAPVRLTIDSAEDIVELMRKADPSVWGNLDVERAKSNWADAYILGIMRGTRLVSVGLTRFVDFGSNIGAIATDGSYRNMGFATSIVSALVEEILRKSPPALIHVLGDNASAAHVYSKIGFKPYKQYLLVRGEKIRD
jgi:GNAT superfamily N-acetyltransferase